MLNKNRIYKADNKILLKDFENQLACDDTPKGKLYILNKMISCDSENDAKINYNDINDLLSETNNSYIIILRRDVSSCIDVLVDILDKRLHGEANGVLLNIRMKPSLDNSILSNIMDTVNQNIDDSATLIFSTCEDVKDIEICDDWIELTAIITC